MIITTIDLSKPRKIAQEQFDDIVFNMRMKNIDVDKYGKIVLRTGISIGLSLLLPAILPVHASPITLKNLPDPNCTAKTIETVSREFLSNLPIIGASLEKLTNGIDMVLDAPANLMLKSKTITELTPWVAIYSFIKAVTASQL